MEFDADFAKRVAITMPDGGICVLVLTRYPTPTAAPKLELLSADERTYLGELTINLSDFDLRSYDADFGFKRHHVLLDPAQVALWRPLNKAAYLYVVEEHYIWTQRAVVCVARVSLEF